MGLHAPPGAARNLSWRARLSSLPRVVASASPRLSRALPPVSVLWVSRLIPDAVAGRISRGSGTLAGIGKLAVGTGASPSPRANRFFETRPATRSRPGTARALLQNINFNPEPHDSMRLIGIVGKVALVKLLARPHLVAPGERYAALFEFEAAGYR
jgi:hypothetical protein